MKSIAIALLLTVSVCVGQDRAYRDSAGIGTGAYVLHPYKIFDQTQKFEDLYNARLEDFATIFVILWDEYAKECWADSGCQRVHVAGSWCNVYPESPEICRNAEHYINKWIHPTKPNPEGFVEFLRRKTK